MSPGSEMQSLAELRQFHLDRMRGLKGTKTQSSRSRTTNWLVSLSRCVCGHYECLRGVFTNVRKTFHLLYCTLLFYIMLCAKKKKKSHTRLDHSTNKTMSFGKHRSVSGRLRQQLSTQSASQGGNWGPEDGMGGFFFLCPFVCF